MRTFYYLSLLFIMLALFAGLQNQALADLPLIGPDSWTWDVTSYNWTSPTTLDVYAQFDNGMYSTYKYYFSIWNIAMYGYPYGGGAKVLSPVQFNMVGPNWLFPGESWRGLAFHIVLDAPTRPLPPSCYNWLNIDLYVREYECEGRMDAPYWGNYSYTVHKDFFVDSYVPEPGNLIILAGCLSGMLICFRRQRR